MSTLTPELLVGNRRLRRPRDIDDLNGRLTVHGFTVGDHDPQIEVLVGTMRSRPTSKDMRRVWKHRRADRAVSLLVAVLHNSQGNQQVTLCGPVNGMHPPVVTLDAGYAARVLGVFLGEENRERARRAMLDVLDAPDSPIPGLGNNGLFSTHHLVSRFPTVPEWNRLCSTGLGLFGLSGDRLLIGLGHQMSGPTGGLQVLTCGGVDSAVAVVLVAGETTHGVSERFGTSPANAVLTEADRRRLPWAVVVDGQVLTLFATGTQAGVGRKGRTDTWLRVDLRRLGERHAGYVTGLFGPDGLRPGGFAERALEESRDYASGLSERLRERVYTRAMPALAVAVGRRRQETEQTTDLGPVELAEVYEDAVTILFRVMFIAYAEDRDLLPYRRNSTYQDNSLKRVARHFADTLDQGDDLLWDTGDTKLWEQLRRLFRTVDQGNSRWGVPRYNGGLFTTDPDVSASGARIAGLELTDDEIGPVLEALLVDRTPDGVWGPVDFRELSVREFGSVYEGLLESMVSVAPVDMTVDSEGTFVPARAGDRVEVPAGEVYFHDRSGARKASGAYFTPPFAVEHVLGVSLRPALEDHAARVREVARSEGPEAASRVFFDFKVCDPAMGSGHFLVTAVDEIERVLAGLLVELDLPGVEEQIRGLRVAALRALGDAGDPQDIDPGSVLRRLIARRCVYGVDINPVSVELARVAVWIHTFVPGLALSFLDHNLVCGDSLTGFVTVGEMLDVLDPGRSLLGELVRGPVEAAAADLAGLAERLETDHESVKTAATTTARVGQTLAGVRNLFDYALAVRAGTAARRENYSGLLEGRERVDLGLPVRPVHFPLDLPEVFTRSRAGFDCLIGNPPWEKIKVDEHAFWGLRFPGLRGLRGGDMEAEIRRLRAARPDLVAEYETEVAEKKVVNRFVTAAPCDFGSGDADLAKVFAWRFWTLTADRGRFGVVLPRTVAVASTGTAPWRREILERGEFTDITTLENRNGWVFPGVHNAYSVVLLGVRKGGVPGDKTVVFLPGPATSLVHYRELLTAGPVTVPVDEFRGWSDDLTVPCVPSRTEAELWVHLKRHPRFNDPTHPWEARPIRELDATGDKGLMAEVCRPGFVPVYGGRSFNLWTPDTGEYYRWADPAQVDAHLHGKRVGQTGRNGVYRGMPEEWLTDRATLPNHQPRVAFRDITNRTNERTVVVALVPPDVYLTNAAPWLFFPSRDPRDEAFVLGVMSSVPFDWTARRVVELHLNFYLLNQLPVPRLERDDPLRIKIERTAGRLATVDDRYATWAAQVGVPCGPLTDHEKQDLIIELDALVAHAYQLDPSQVRVMFDTFGGPVSADTTRRDRVAARVTELRDGAR